MFSKILLVALFCAYVSCQDECKDTSVAITVTNTIVGAGLSSLGRTTSSTAEVKAILEAMQQTLQFQTSGSTNNVYALYGNNNSYFVFSCRAYIGAGTCSSPFGFVYEYRNDAIFGSLSPYYTRRTVYSSLADVEAGTPEGSTEPFDSTTYPPYLFVAGGSTGWTDPFRNTNTGLFTSAYVSDADYLSDFAVWGSDRLPTEPCSLCLQRLQAVNLAGYLAGAPGLSAIRGSTQEARNGTADLLAASISFMDSNYISAAWIYTPPIPIVFGGMPVVLPQTFYRVTNCYLIEDVERCKEASTQYVFSVTDSATIGEILNYELLDNFTINPSLSSSDGALVAPAEWTQTLSGWTPEYQIEADVLFSRSYLTAFNGGFSGVNPTENAIRDSCDDDFPYVESKVQECSASSLQAFSALLALVALWGIFA